MRGWTAAQDRLLVKLHAQGLLNRDLAGQLGVSESTVKRRKQALDLGSNCPCNELGAWGEEALLQVAQARGMSARIVSKDRHPFDVDVEGMRVEVKTASFCGGQWRFRLPATRPSFHSEAPPTPKDYVRDCDLIAFVARGRAASEPPFFHFRVPTPGLSNVTLSPDDLPGIRDNWGVLEGLLARKAA